MPNITPNPITVIPAKTSGGSLKNPANLIGYSAAAQGPQAELWANVQKALKDAQSQLDGLANSLRAPLAIPDPIQVVDAQGNLVANIGTYVNPLTNGSFTGIWAKNFAANFDPLGNGAVGDGVHDDTNAIQQTFNQTGVLFLAPGKTYLISSTITVPSGFTSAFVYGGGFLTTSTNSLTMLSNTSTANLRIYNTVFINNGTNGVGVSVSGVTANWNEIRGCYFSLNTGGTGISLTNITGIWSILECVFAAGATGISLNTPVSLTNIVDCSFQTTTPIATSGAVTYNVKACNTVDHWGSPVNRQYAEFTGTTQTFTAGAGFSNITSLSITANATGTWLLSINVFVSQTGNISTLRFAKNAVGDAREAVMQGGTGLGAMFHLDFQVALTSGDVITAQLSATTSNATVQGSGNSAATNIGAVLLGN